MRQKTTTERADLPVGAAVPAAMCYHTQAARLPLHAAQPVSLWPSS